MKRRHYKVWDATQSEADHAAVYFADSAESAAEKLASADTHGLIEGIYDKGRLIYARDGNGMLFEVEVMAEYEPHFVGRLVKVRSALE